MPIFTDLVYDEASGRHTLFFVNQQYDFLMYICYDEKSRQYKLNVSEAEAKKIAGEDFDLPQWLKKAEERIREADANRKK